MYHAVEGTIQTIDHFFVTGCVCLNSCIICNSKVFPLGKVHVTLSKLMMRYCRSRVGLSQWLALGHC